MWDGHACAIGEASASMMTEAVTSQSADTARAWVKTVRAMITGRGDADGTLELGDIESLRVVRNRPARVKCALLAWEAFDEALTLAEAVHARPRESTDA
jgi:nitrogen fixation NifU-like protein